MANSSLAAAGELFVFKSYGKRVEFLYAFCYNKALHNKGTRILSKNGSIGKER